MKKVAILGAGLVTKPLADYFIDKCKYKVIMATRTVSKARSIIAGRELGQAVQWTIKEMEKLDQIVREVDLVVSMIPPTIHPPVAELCLSHQKNMVTTSYISPQMAALDEKAKNSDIIILNEIGEDPGLDHMGAKHMIDLIKSKGGKIVSLTSYGAGLPAFEHNRNPFGYKFSWSPKGVMLAARTPAAYLKNGKRIEVPAENLFDHHWLEDIEGLGTFETYPNRDSTRYVKYFELEGNVSLYRGLLRFTGWCNTMKNLIKLNLLETAPERDFQNESYAGFMSSIIGTKTLHEIQEATAKYLGLDKKDDTIKRMKWLGLFDTNPIAISQGANVDVLVDLMLKKMSYGPNEKDMIIVHDEVVAEYPDCIEKRLSTLMLEGIPGGDSAMSRAVSLPAAIAGRLILEGKIRSRGVLMPTISEIYRPVLDELKEFGIDFTHRQQVSDKDSQENRR
jgi:saccharopine dehydrogenase-like NADP-dependent oxidoreductase